MTSLLVGWLLGLAQGLRHALEPDHVAAVSTMVAEQRSARASVFFAAMWGAGHAFMLLAVGGVLFVLRQEMPERLAHAFEVVVAAMLIALGLRALGQATRTEQRRSTHVHGMVTDRSRARGWRRARRPLVIGVVHGLAGSGALTALVAGTYPSAATGLFFMLCYGLGAMLGMALVAGFAGVPLARAMRTRYGAPILLGLTGAFSLVLGFVWGWPIVHAMVSR